MTSQKTALVTGTSQGGLGDYLAQELHRRGFRVIATARTPSKVQHLKDLGLDIVLLEVTDAKSVEKAAAEVNDLTGGKLDILINNSGVGSKAALLDVDLAASKAVFDVNIWGVLQVTQAFSHMVIASKGTIINIGSVAARVPLPFQGIYNMSKAALEHLSRQMRLEMEPFGIKVIHVVTGGIATPFYDHAGDAEFSKFSLYYPGREALGPWLSGQVPRRLQPTPPEEYAKAVIDNALSRFPSSVQYTGYGSFAAWFFSKCLWGNAMDYLLVLMGVPSIKKAIFGNKKDA
ncbi:hypothetical protein EDB81DRAFT_96747 [Dactylonectria macrodidyma]|uniref:NAD(P)-binding protein n=1 Tax=Dactylonectria macrodidyma TaxID=307937 RepID=A0A9P9IXA1_9HYPO|nr:hypothetical protein EDB81DRAFT_96747 [Dactylonectria macrodidyma]